MDKFGLIGDPIAKSLSPALFSIAYGGKYQYDLIQTSSFDKAWSEFLSGYKAINVTAPFKVLAYEKADILSPEAAACGASNLCVKTPEGVIAYNSDYLGVKAIVEERFSLLQDAVGATPSAAIIGYGGAGKAALCASKDCGYDCKLYRHNEISNGLEADLVVYTLPSAVEGIDKIKCKFLLEANYKNPALSQREAYIDNYISGKKWHLMQAITGYFLMTGEKPDNEAMKEFYSK